MYVPGAHRDQKMLSGPLEQMVENYHVDARN